MCIHNSHDDPNRIANVIAAKFNIGSELGIICYTSRTISLNHSSDLILYDAAVVITAIIDVRGKNFPGPVIG
jgi:hypothetical protein